MASATKYVNSQPQEDIKNPLLSAEEPLRPTPPAGDLESPSPQDRGQDYTIPQSLFSVYMTSLFVAATCGVGGTQTAIQNLGQIGRALGYPASTATTFISLIGIWIYLGRVVSDSAPGTFISKYEFPRPLMFSLVVVLPCFGHLLIAFGVPNSLFVASVIIGFSFGAQLRLLFAIISEIFGPKYCSTLQSFAALVSPVGMHILNVNVAGRLYNQEALKQMKAKGLKMLAGEDLTCTGVECYKKVFIVITAITLFGFVVSLVLVLRTRKLYRKFREQADEAAEAEEGANAVEQRSKEASRKSMAGSASTNPDEIMNVLEARK